MTAIQGSAQLLQKTIKKQKKAQQDHTGQKQHIDWEIAMLDTITRQTKRMSKLIKEMVDSAHIQAQMFELQKKADVNIVELAQRVIAQYTQGEQHNNIALQCEEETILGTWDEDRIEQVLINLITNTLKYSPADKPIVVQIEQNGQHHEEEVIISVQDYGPGISEEDQAHIFNRFYQADKENHKKQEGLGLGLYISHEIVTYHGGRIWVRSNPGQGSTFYFTLPLQKLSNSSVKLLPEDSGIKKPQKHN